jgi:uncharacterized protein (DUF58 family)
LGGSGEFVDYREYAPGDDLRRVDWKAMGRMGRPYLKLYQDETDLKCTFLIDSSGSMLQGGRSPLNHQGSKLEWAQYFATALSHLIVLHRDAAGLAAVHEEKTLYLPPSSSSQQKVVLHQSIESLFPKGKTRLDTNLADINLRGQRRGVLVILSDFLVDQIEPTLANIRQLKMRGWEVIALHLVHPDEEHLPAGNAFRFVGLEFDGFVSCHTTQVRRDYEKRFEQHMDRTRSNLLGVGSHYHRISTQKSYLDVLRSFLIARN